jgi:phenylpropionate dioxygenase-like ring-hydroxylating dioxygenase large terminal subunit
VLRLLFDSCRHRGAMVCRASKGNASLFRCSYHGWTYKNTGEFAGAPLFKAAYGDSFDRRNWGLLTAPQLESLHGFVFASLDPEAPSLDEYLGDMKWYFDMMFGQVRDGWDVVGDPQRWIVDSNWKTGAENFAGDDYHLLFLHRSIKELGLLGSGDDKGGMQGHHIQAGNGHSLSHVVLPPGTPGPRFWSWPEPDALFEPRYGEEMYALAERTFGNVGTIFPNLGFLSFPLALVEEARPDPTLFLRLLQPRSATSVEMLNWILVPKGLAAEARTSSHRTTQGTFGTSGIFDQDDTEPWGAMSRLGSSPFARKAGMRLNYMMGLDGSGGEARRVDGRDDHAGPGVKYFPAVEEGVQRGFYRRWAQFMRSERYPANMSAEEQNGNQAARSAAARGFD